MCWVSLARQGAIKLWPTVVIIGKDPFNKILVLFADILQPPDEFIQVHFLETSDDHGILDPDDMLCDVVDDKDKVILLHLFLLFRVYPGVFLSNCSQIKFKTSI